jgi:hypothetical protein
MKSMMLLRGQFQFKRFLSNSVTSTLRQYQLQSKQRMRFRKYVWTLGVLFLPISCLSVYDRFASLPEPLNQTHFPLISRFYIRKALWNGSDLEAVAKSLDAALWGVLAAGYGAASPQATALVVYLSRRYLADPNTQPTQLEDAMTALLHKPHVGTESQFNDR